MKKHTNTYTIFGLIVASAVIIAIWFSSAQTENTVATAGDGNASTTISNTESEATNLQGLE